MSQASRREALSRSGADGPGGVTPDQHDRITDWRRKNVRRKKDWRPRIPRPSNYQNV